ncbi:thiamine phosphate synthase [Corynebacterium kroppenstedtii]|uniref:thiamine phosphate synthase n=1 Tax=Corynebacterium sp. PCR 32 TaxID=3351342 RepID=UPI00309C6354
MRYPETDFRIYLVTSGTDDHTIDTAASVAAAGAGVVQVRAKELPTRDLLGLVTACATAVQRANPTTKVVVDDRADVAYAARLAGAPVHGVHLGQDDLPAEAARAMLGSDALIGLTTGTLPLVHKAEEVHRAQPGVLDYIGAGPFRPTPTKTSGREPLGVDGYRTLVAATSLPIIAIGDITPDDVEALSATGIAGCAMVRALMHAENPGETTRRALAHFHC